LPLPDQQPGKAGPAVFLEQALLRLS